MTHHEGACLVMDGHQALALCKGAYDTWWSNSNSRGHAVGHGQPMIQAMTYVVGESRASAVAVLLVMGSQIHPPPLAADKWHAKSHQTSATLIRHQTSATVITHQPHSSVIRHQSSGHTSNMRTPHPRHHASGPPPPPPLPPPLTAAR